MPIDYIAGTSIGAVVGGFYVSGMTFPELEEFRREHRVGGRVREHHAAAAAARSGASATTTCYLVNQKSGLNDGEFAAADRSRPGPGHRHDHVARRRCPSLTGRGLRRARDSVPRGCRRPRDGRGRDPRAPAASRARFARACRSPRRCRRSRSTDGCSSTAASSMNLPVEVAQRDGRRRHHRRRHLLRAARPRRDADRCSTSPTQLTNLLTRAGTVQQSALWTRARRFAKARVSRRHELRQLRRHQRDDPNGYDTVMEQRDRTRAVCPRSAGVYGATSPDTSIRV